MKNNLRRGISICVCASRCQKLPLWLYMLLRKDYNYFISDHTLGSYKFLYVLYSFSNSVLAQSISPATNDLMGLLFQTLVSSIVNIMV